MAEVWLTGTQKLAAAAAAQVLALQTADGLTDAERTALQAAVLAKAQRKATSFNDALLAAQLQRELKEAVSPLGLAWYEPADEQLARLADAVTTVGDTDVAYVDALPDEEIPAAKAASLAERLTRLADGETTRASHWARSEGIYRHGDGLILGWYWKPSAGACNRCLAMTGSYTASYTRQYGTAEKAGPRVGTNIHPPWHRFTPRHPDCHCSQEIVTGTLHPSQRWLGKPGTTPSLAKT